MVYVLFVKKLFNTVCQKEYMLLLLAIVKASKNNTSGNCSSMNLKEFQCGRSSLPKQVGISCPPKERLLLILLGGNSNVSGQGAGRRATGANPSEAAIRFLGGNSNVDAQGAGRRVIDLVRVAMINLVGLGVQDSGHSASKTNTKLKSKYKAAHREVFCYAQS